MHKECRLSTYTYITGIVHLFIYFLSIYDTQFWRKKAYRVWVKKCNNAISPVLSAPRAIVAAPRPPATPGRIQCRLVGPKKNSWCRPGPQWSPTRVSSRLLQVALGVKRAGVSGPDGLQNAPRLRVLRTWHLRRA